MTEEVVMRSRLAGLERNKELKQSCRSGEHLIISKTPNLDERFAAETDRMLGMKHLFVQKEVSAH